MAFATLYAPQRVNYKPESPDGVSKMTDPKQVLVESLKKLADKKQQRLMSQSPAAVMGAVTNPKDIVSGMKPGVLGNIDIAANRIGGR